MVGIAKPPRTPWEFFPDVFIHASESAVKQHPAYTAAKAGDDDAAIALVLDAFSKERALEMKRFEGDAKPTLERLHELRAKHGQEFESWWFERFAHTFDALTESEARYLARTETADIVRDRIAAAEQAGNR